MTKSKYFIAAALSVLAVASQAQQVRVATGSGKGTYHALFANIADKCGEKMAMVEVPSSGSLENLDLLTGKQVGAAFMQTDALFASAQGRDLGNIKTLVAFNPESVHVVALSNSGMKTGGTLGFGAKDVVFNAAEDLAGYKVAAAGGSMITAQLIKLQGQLNWTVVPVSDADAAIAAVKSGAVQAAVLVGGQPLGNVKALGAGFKLLGFRNQTVELLKTVYVPSKLSYPKLANGAVSSIATEALLVTRTYNTSEKIATLAAFRKCIQDNVPEWQDADGAHPAWAQVDVNNHGKWAWYDLPAPAVAKVVSKKK
jgi:TRAP-type uncharacterized transport system substrate-binding protein